MALDIVGDLVSRLSVELSPVPVHASVPNPRPPELVAVTREGGRRRDALVDTAGIGIECFAPTPRGAYLLADAAARAMGRLPFAGGYASVTQEAMYSDPDPETGRPRWYLSYTIDNYEPRG